MANRTTIDEYITLIDEAKVYDVASKTPLALASNLSARIGNRIFMKREDLQPVFSFKLRGAYNKLATLPQAALDAGVICSSAGNHAQGVALAAQKKGCSSRYRIALCPVSPGPVTCAREKTSPYQGAMR